MNFTEISRKPELSECSFYTTTTFPSGNTVVGEWDLGDKTDVYLGRQGWAGKRVLDVGAASGALSFFMESKNATVVSLDVADNAIWELLPPRELEHDEQEWRDAVQCLKNSYWYSHHEYGSKCQVLYCDIYNIPTEVGKFHTAVLGSVLLHVSNPFKALESVCALVEHSVVVTDMHWPGAQGIVFAPDITHAENRCAWWYMPHTQVERMLEVLGFQRVWLETFDIHSERHKRKSTFYCMVCTRKEFCLTTTR